MYSKYGLLIHVDTRHGHGKRWHDYVFQTAEVAFVYEMLATKAVNRDAAPFALHASEALGRPACFLAVDTLGIGRQIAFAPVMSLRERFEFAIGYVGGRLAAVVHREYLTVNVNKIIADYLFF